MLQKLNERIQGVAAWIVVILISVTFMLFGVDYYLQSRHETAAQVTVNGQVITKQAFDLNYKRTRQLRDLSEMTAARENQLKQQVLNEMILNNLSVNSARNNGFEVYTSQANGAILSIPQFQEDGHFSTGRYSQALNSAYFTPESFQQEVRQGMLLNQQRFALIGTAFALPNELKQFVRLYMQTRDYAYLKIPALRFLNQAKVSNEEVSTYYQQNKHIFLSPEQVSIDYIVLSMADIKQGITLTPEQLKHYYDENQSNYLTPAEWRVEKMLVPLAPEADDEFKLKVKADVEELSKKLETNPKLFVENTKSSIDNKDLKTTNELGTWIVAGQSVFDKELVNLTTAGQISTPILTDKGYVFLKLLQYKPAAYKPFEAVESNIREQYTNELAQEKYTKMLEQLSDLSYQTPDSLAPVADALNLKVQHSLLFTRHGDDQNKLLTPQVIRAAFNHDVLKFGNNSEPIQLSNDSVMVLRVNQHVPAAEKTLVDVRSLIENNLMSKKAEALAKQFGQEILVGDKQNKTETKLEHEKWITEQKLAWQDVNAATRDGDRNMAPLNELAFSLPRVGQETGGSLANGNFVLVRLKKITEGNLDTLDKEQKASITQQVEASYGLMDYDLYINALMNQAQVVRH